MVVYRREREREKELSFPLLKILKLKRRKELEIVVYVAREDTQRERKREGERERSLFVSSLSEKTQYTMITWSNNSAPFVARQNASINLLASSHRRSDVTSYSTFGKYTCQSRGGRALSRGVHRE